MDVDSRLRRVLEREGASLQPDVPAALREVHGRARRSTTKRRVLAVVAATAAVVAAIGILAGARGVLHRADAPPSQHPDAPSVSLSVVRQRSAADLGIGRALGVAVGANGHLYVTDTSQHVTELTPDLRLVRSWGGGGTAPGRFRLIQGSVATGPHGRVYVSDTGNFRVQTFSRSGRYLGQVGTFGTGPGQFTWPFDLAIDATGSMYVADDKAETLTKLTPAGRQVWRRGEKGVEKDLRLLGHEHLAGFDPSGRLVTVNDDRGVVLFLDASGNVDASFGATKAGPLGDREVNTADGLFPQGACDATADAQGFIYVTSCGEATDAHWTGVFLQDGTRVGSWADSPLVDSPRWGPGGRGYVVTSSGGVAEVRATAH